MTAGSSEEIHAVKRTVPPRVSWGALFAGLVLLVGLGWLFSLLGAALGVNIADLQDVDVLSQGFGIGVAVWIVISSIVVYFLAAMCTAALAGSVDRRTGMLHGLTLWGLVTTLGLVLGGLGLGGFGDGAGRDVIRSSIDVDVGDVQATARATADDEGLPDVPFDALADTAVFDAVQAEVARAASEALAGMAAEAGADVTGAELRRAVRQVEAPVLVEAGRALAEGRAAEARRILARDTELSAREIDAVVQGALQRLNREIPEIPDLSEAEALEQVQQRVQGWTGAAYDEMTEGLADLAAPTLSEREVRGVLEALDVQTVRRVARHIVMGEPERAKSVLAARTPISEEEIDTLVDRVTSETRTAVQAVREEIVSAADRASDYLEALLWALFAGAILALAASVAGGAVGASGSARRA